MQTKALDIAAIISALPPFFRRHKLIQLLLLISPESCIQLIQFNNSARLFADLREPWPRQILITGSCEPEFSSIASKFLAKGGIFFDVGANTGSLSFGLMAYLDSKNVEYHLFEANPKLCQLLDHSKKLNSDQRIWINNFCVTEKPGFSKLNIHKNNSAISFVSEQGQQEITNLVLDDYIAEKSIEKIEFLKIDIEGHEPLAIKGLMRSMTKGVLDAIYVEISSTNLYRAGFSAKNVFDLLKEGGFNLFYVKQADFESGLANKSKIVTLNVHGSPLTVASVEVETFPYEYQTDILAVHQKSNLA